MNKKWIIYCPNIGEHLNTPSWKVAEKLKTNCSYNQKQKAMDRKKVTVIHVDGSNNIGLR